MRARKGSRANLSPWLEQQLKTFLTNSEDSWEEGPCNLCITAQWTQLKPFFPFTSLREIIDQGGASRTRLLEITAPGQSRTHAAFTGNSDFSLKMILPTSTWGLRV